MKREGICVAGNMIVDVTYPIKQWPMRGELTTITDGITRSTGGLACNVLIDLAKLDPELPLQAIGLVGDDVEGAYILNEFEHYPNIDTSGIRRQGSTSFTAVMSDNIDKVRTFFHYRGANSLLDENNFNLDQLECSLLHVGYVLLLDALDEEDAEYGTKLARLLHNAQVNGIRTSIDVVSEAGDRFVRVVTPALKYTDYCIINEIEAQQTTGIQLRDEDNFFHANSVKAALKQIMNMGVSEWAVIHCPEGGFGMDRKGHFVQVASYNLPKDFIKGTVGAGDAFCTGVLYAAYKGLTLEEGLHMGIGCATASLRKKGASEGMCSIEEVRHLMEQMDEK